MEHMASSGQGDTSVTPVWQCTPGHRVANVTTHNNLSLSHMSLCTMGEGKGHQ